MGQATNHLAIWAWSLVCSRASSLLLPCGKKGSEVHQGDTRLHPIKPEMDVLSSVNVQAWIPLPLSLLHVLVENHRVTFGMRHLLTENRNCLRKKTPTSSVQMVVTMCHAVIKLRWSCSSLSMQSSSQPIVRCLNCSWWWIRWVRCSSCEGVLLAL